jgi:hypothetical protein
MRKILAKIILSSLLPITAFAAQPAKPLPAPDFSSVSNCMQSMMNDMADIGWSAYGTLFSTAMNEGLGSLERGVEGDMCYANFTGMSFCRLVSRTNSGVWGQVNGYIRDDFMKEAQDAIRNEIENYNAGKETQGPLVYSIHCAYQCSKGLNINTDCKRTIERG